MDINPSDVKQRWDSIREKESLALDPESVSDYLNKKESEIVRERIQETLTQLALYRVQEGYFHSDKPVDGKGDLATCEGLESFLIPAVEGALALSTFLEKFSKTAPEKKEELVTALTIDIEALVLNWGKGSFSGKPYSNDSQIKTSLDPTIKKASEINITETAAMACRVLIHLMTLKLNRSDEQAFQDQFGEVLDEEKMFGALRTAMEFLVRAFQKSSSEKGESTEEMIANAKVGSQSGSGWGWTDWEGLTPMLFFTASAVDAFAELDLYLIRPAESGDLAKGNEDQKKLLDFYNTNKATLMNFQLCVDMARRWVQKLVLPHLSKNYGLYKEDVKYDYENEQKPEWYAVYKEELLSRIEEFEPPPVVLYNNLYSLQILLWSWGDWNESGSDYDEESKSMINRALAQLVYNYDSIHVVKDVLRKYPCKFYLPAKKYFAPKFDNTCEYIDAGFLPLLTRLLVLFVVYGVGDRNLLEPVIRDLYIELLQNRNRNSLEYSALWSSDLVEVFSTQRAIQALTFYFAYARGKEQVSGGDINTISRVKLGLTLFLDAITKDSFRDDQRQSLTEVAQGRPESVDDHPPPLPERFIDYCHELSDKTPPLMVLGDNPVATSFIEALEKQGDEILSSYNKGKIKDYGAARLVLNSLWRLWVKPMEHKELRQLEFELLKEQYTELMVGHPTL